MGKKRFEPNHQEKSTERGIRSRSQKKWAAFTYCDMANEKRSGIWINVKYTQARDVSVEL